MLRFDATKKQYNALEGLAYWRADAAYIVERFGKDEPELKHADETIKNLFNELDRLGVPFWVQNSVMAWAEDWRRYKSQYFSDAMTKRNIFKIA